MIKGAGVRLRTEHLSARSTVSLLSYCRATVIVGKHGHTIVERNRLRRRLRELVRVNLIPECAAIDLILRALPTAYDADFSILSSEVELIRSLLGSTIQAE